MATGYKLAQNGIGYFKKFNTPNIFFEGENYVEFFAQPYDKYTLAKFKSSKDPHFMYSPVTNNWATTNYSNNPLTPHTMGRIYSEYFNELRFNFRYPFAPDQTIFRNNLTFDDGTEIISGMGTDTKWVTALHKYKYNKMEKFLEFENYLNVTPLIKINEEKFITVVNTEYPNSFQNEQNRVSANAAAPYYSALIYYTNSSNVPSDRIVLYDKELNAIKNLSVGGELLNIIGKSNSGNLIGIVMKYKLDGNFKQVLTVVSITPDLVLTEISSCIVANGVSGFKYNNFYYQPALSKDKSRLYFMIQNNLNVVEFAKFEINIEVGTCSNAIPVTTPDGNIFKLPVVASTTNGEKGLPVYSYNMFELEYGTTKFLVVSPVISRELLSYKENNYSYSSIEGITNIYNYLNANWNNFANIWLFKLNDTNNTLSLKETRIQGASFADPVKAILPVNSKTLLVIRNTMMDIFSIDVTNDALIQHESIAGPFHGIGVDSLERVWYIKDDNNADIEMISPGLSATVTVDFEDNDLLFESENISNNILINSTNYNGDRISVNLKLTLEGNAIFTENNLKTVNVVSKLDQELVVPITVTGDGIINVYTSIAG